MGLFGRQVQLAIGDATGKGREFSQLRTTFEVKMSSSSSPSEGTFELYNPAPESIALAQAPGAVVRLLAGYDVPLMLFQGDPSKDGVRLDRRGPDRVLHLECKDGGRAYKTARLNISFSRACTMREVYDEVAKQMGLPQGTIRLKDDLTFPHGVTLTGPARDILDRLATSSGSEWQVRDGALQFIGVGEDTGESAVVFSAKAGNLIGSPSRKDGGVEVKALLAPSLRPGKLFVVKSAETNGVFVATNVEFTGDSGFGQDFYVKVVGKPSTRTVAG